MITGLAQMLGKCLAIAAGAIAALLLVRKASADKARLEERLKQSKEASDRQQAQTEASAKRIEEVTQNALETKRNTGNLSDSDVDQRLRDKWDG